MWAVASHQPATRVVAMVVWRPHRLVIALPIRHFAASSQAAPAVERTTLHPPGAGVAVEKSQKFTRLVSDSIARGIEVELNPIGDAAMWHSLRALSADQGASQFRVSWLSKAASSGNSSGDNRQQILIRAAPSSMLSNGARAEFSTEDLENGYFVSNSTNGKQLAKKLEIELREQNQITLHTYADATYASGAIVRALATVPSLRAGGFLSLPGMYCWAGGVQRAGESIPRIVVHARMDSLGLANGDHAKDFIAYPPGANADGDEVSRFMRTVSSRIAGGRVVSMECRGKDAVLRSIAALASVRNYVAEFGVGWSESSLKADCFANSRVLRVRARRGVTWSQFNSTKFPSTKLLRVADDTEVMKLARTLGVEARLHGGAAVHVRIDQKEVISKVVKALASVPAADKGQRVACVPSWVSSRHGGDQGSRLLRFYVRPPQGSLEQIPSD